MYAKYTDTERPIFREWVYYDSLNVVPNQPTAVYVLDNANISPQAAKTINLPGTWMIVTDGFGQYGHFLREGVGAYLYCKTIFPELKPLFLRVLPRETSELLEETIDYVFERLSRGMDSLHHFVGNAIHDVNFKFEKLIVMLDNGRLLTARSHPNFFECRTPQIASCLVDYFSDLRVFEPGLPDKIFVTRRRRNLELSTMGKTQDPWYKTRFIDERTMEKAEMIFSENGYEVIDFGEMTFPDQVKYSYNAAKFAGFLGTGFHNGIWCRDGSEFYGIQTGTYGFDWKHDIVSTLENARFSLIKIEENAGLEEMRSVIQSNAI